MKRFSSFIFLALISTLALAQPYFKRVDSIPVLVSGSKLKNPWAGGITLGQFSTIDLNFDGKKDLFIFERIGNKITTFINQGITNTSDYKHAFEYQSQFPPLHDWAILVDYNCDGKEDIFSYSDKQGGIAVYRNDSEASKGLKFTLVKDIIKSDYQPNYLDLYISSVDIPAITDIDGDGDIDILTFSIVGNIMEWHENRSKDDFGNCDSLTFKLNTSCWGNFFENAMNNSVTLNKCRSGKKITPEEPKRHAGSCELCIDLNGDQAKEIILGDLSHNNLVMLTNGGTAKGANMIAQDTIFPKYDMPVDLSIFPCAYFIDVDNDNLNDLIVSPNAMNASENKNSVLFYKNTGNAGNVQFKYQQKDFLQKDMIELGEGAYPVFFDYNNDGLKDLLVGNYGYFNGFGSMSSQVSLFKNIGTSLQPKFELITDDFLNLSTQLAERNLIPAFGDIDGDGDEDMLVGNYNGELDHFQNMAGAGNPANFSLTQGSYAGIDSIDVGTFAVPQIIDVDRDGKNDLLIGEASGNLNYYRNTGSTTNPRFKLVSNQFGGVNVTKQPFNSTGGYSYPFLFNYNGSYNLLVGSENGYIYYYTNIDGNLGGNFTLTDSTYLNIWEGKRIGLYGADISSDGLMDLVIGNYVGGLGLYMGAKPNSIEEKGKTQNISFHLFPNPAFSQVTVNLNEKRTGEKRISILNMMGQEVLHHNSIANSTTLDIAGLSTGLYFCKITWQNKNETGIGFQKLVIGPPSK